MSRNQSSDKKGQKKGLRAKLAAVLGGPKMRELEDLIRKERAIPPRIAVMGKAGVGKTTTINELFNMDWTISHAAAGTREPRTEYFDLTSDVKVAVIDMPGLGEDLDADIKYFAMYQDLMPNVDVVLWIVQANARDLSEDQRILKEVVSTGSRETLKRVVIGLNQVDKIGPGNWDEKLNYPSPDQAVSIARRCHDISEKLAEITRVDPEQIVYYSARRRFRLAEIKQAMIHAAGEKGWKLPVRSSNPLELADSEVQEFARTLRNPKKD